jgi:N-acetylglucosaminyl-diphospho-decaprenol L-rhamnosyltransferase
VVVTHDGRELALATLRSAMRRVGDLAVEWHVVDSGSTDGTPEAIDRQWPTMALTRLPNVGFASASNIALRTARGRYVLLLNPDVEIVSGTFAALVRALDSRPEVGLASVLQRAPDGAIIPSICRDPSPARQLGEALGASRLGLLRRLQEPVADARTYDAECSAEWLLGALLIVRRETLAAVGGLDERFFLYSEETDWCRRVRTAGWDVRHLPLMTIVHHAGRSERPDLFAQRTHSKSVFAGKHLSLASRVAFRAALATRHLLRAIVFTPMAAARPVRRARLRAEVAALSIVLGLRRPTWSPLTPNAQGRTPWRIKPRAIGRLLTIRRAMDLLVAALGLAVLAPAFMLIALAILLDDGGAVIFSQTRVGRGGRLFRILKFRTMALTIASRAPSGGPLRKDRDDPRCTRVGRFLRRSHLDELPQLVNIIRGDMTLVGPRPLVPTEDAIVIRSWAQRRHERPGLTGEWQVLRSAETTVEELIELDQRYLARRSPWRELNVLARTACCVARRSGR